MSALKDAGLSGYELVTESIRAEQVQDQQQQLHHQPQHQTHHHLQDQEQEEQGQQSGIGSGVGTGVDIDGRGGVRNRLRGFRE